MKILILQLTRFGDVLLTLPVLKALKREHPEAEIHFLVRKKFSEPAAGLGFIDHLWVWDSEEILSPLVSEGVPGLEVFKQLVSKKIESLKSERFDRIINLSFSPSSSWLTHLIASNECKVSGYSRTNDGFLDIPDEWSRYFFAHVGTQSYNRVHVVDLFASISGVHLQLSDLRIWDLECERQGVVLHLGASQMHKRWPTEYWREVVKALVAAHVKVTIVGGADDAEIASRVTEGLPEGAITNFTGKTKFRDLLSVISQAQIFVGGDSGPLHVANSCGTKILNLSVGQVRFWETGPTVSGSVVLSETESLPLSPGRVLSTLSEMLNGEAVEKETLCRGRVGVRYDSQHIERDEGLGWEILSWLYFDEAPPEVPEAIYPHLQKFLEVDQVAQDLLTQIEKGRGARDAAARLDELDRVVGMIGKLDPVSRVLDSEFRARKASVKPGNFKSVLQETKRCYDWLKNAAMSLGGMS
ncbi:MAG: glycosyltransferase family 9 protein [Oligoflexia bacterium]|nr:glycosyltransferase family 9 protein [Oligoflexia bacterium]